MTVVAAGVDGKQMIRYLQAEYLEVSERPIP